MLAMGRALSSQHIGGCSLSSRYGFLFQDGIDTDSRNGLTWVATNELVSICSLLLLLKVEDKEDNSSRGVKYTCHRRQTKLSAPLSCSPTREECLIENGGLGLECESGGCT